MKSRPADFANNDVEHEAMVRRLTEYWHRQAERIAAALDLDDLENGAAPAVFDALDTEAEILALIPVIQANMQRLAEMGAWEVLEKWNPESDGFSLELLTPWLRKAAETNSSRWVRAVESQLSTAATREEPVKAVATYLSGVGPALAMAGSFAAEAASFGRQDAATKSGLSTKTWQTRSSNPRPEHAALNNVTIGIDDVFSNGLRYPGDYRGQADDTASCRCILVYGKETQ